MLIKINVLYFVFYKFIFINVISTVNYVIVIIKHFCVNNIYFHYDIIKA